MCTQTTEIVLDDLPLLFADDNCLKNSQGTTRLIHPALTLKTPVVKADTPEERGAVSIYGNAIFDAAANQFFMWYSTSKKPSSVLYATSKDTTCWEKPVLSLYPSPGAPTNNIVYDDLHSPCVLFDQTEKDPARKYKMIGKARSRGYVTVESTDGIHWLNPTENTIPGGMDTLTFSQHPRTGEYLCYHKRLEVVRGITRRVVFLSRSADFHSWSEPQLVLVPDEKDDVWASKGQRTDIYNMTVHAHAGGFIGFPTLLRVERCDDESGVVPNQSPDHGPIDIQLAMSPDGIHWVRPEPRVNIIPRGAQAGYDRGGIVGVSQPVHHKDKTYMFYTAMSTHHGAAMPPKEICIGRAQWRLHGFASLNAGASGGILETVPIKLNGPCLVVNADASKGAIQVALRENDGTEIQGYSFNDCASLTRNHTAQTITWRNKAHVPTDRPVCVAFQMSPQARLFSISVSANLNFRH